MKITFVNPLTIIHKDDPTTQDQLNRIEEAIHTMTDQQTTDYNTLKGQLDTISAEGGQLVERITALLAQIGQQNQAPSLQPLIDEAKTIAGNLQAALPAPTSPATDTTGGAAPATT